MNHYLVLKLHNGQDKSDFAQKARHLLFDLADSVDGLKKVCVYENIIDRPDNYDIMIDFEMDGEETLQAYIKHPLHKRFIEYAGPKVAVKISFDR